MKHLSLVLEKLEQRIAPGGVSVPGSCDGTGGTHGSGKSDKSHKSHKSDKSDKSHCTE